VSSEPASTRSPLAEAYWRRRADLLRLFAARSGARDEAEDLLQELFLKIDAIDAASIANPDAYLFRLAMNLMVDHQRRRISRQRRERLWSTESFALDNDRSSFGEAPDAGVERTETVMAIATAIEELPVRTRQAFRLHKLEDLTHAEVAQRMGISKSAVEKHIMRALRRLLPLTEDR